MSCAYCSRETAQACPTCNTPICGQCDGKLYAQYTLRDDCSACTEIYDLYIPTLEQINQVIDLEQVREKILSTKKELCCRQCGTKSCNYLHENNDICENCDTRYLYTKYCCQGCKGDRVSQYTILMEILKFM